MSLHLVSIARPDRFCDLGSYAEASYFDGAAFQHIADFLEMQRLRDIDKRALSLIERRRSPR